MVDVVHWYLGLTRARSAVALGGIYRYNDGRDTPDNINGVVEYPDNLVVTFEATITDMIVQGSADIVFHGSNGRLSIFRYGYRYIPPTRVRRRSRRRSARSQRTWGTGSTCVRTRKQPNADVVSGHYSALSCHLMNIAYKQGGRAFWQREWDV